MSFLVDFVAGHNWVWPLCEILHFLGLTLLVGIVGLIDLRLIGIASNVPLADLYRLVPWALWGFLICLLTGVIFLLGNPVQVPSDVLIKTIFQLKMIFILIGGTNALFLLGLEHDSIQGRTKDDAISPARPQKIVAIISLFCWLSVVYLGRMLPYGDSFYFVFHW